MFKSPVENVFTECEFGSIIKQALGCQLSYSLEKLNEFSLLEDEIIDEVMSEDTPEIILQKRRKIKALKNARKRV